MRKSWYNTFAKGYICLYKPSWIIGNKTRFIKKVVEKVINTKVKSSLQSTLGKREINLKYSKQYKPTKKNKDKANPKLWNKHYIKFINNLFPINTSQP